MIIGDGYNDSVDIWGIGVILFTLLTGKYPFDTSQRENTKKIIFQRILEKNIHYSRYNLERKDVKLLKQLLEKRPEDRIEIEYILDQSFFHSSK
jgi:serine/threonine protein kinase